jgi:large subunit ribosomal protein L7/L12
MVEKTSKIENIIKEIEGLTVLELNELVGALEEKFGVSAAAMAAPAAPAAAEGETGQTEEKAEYDVVLAAAGDQKIKVIKAIREINQQLGLKEAKELVESAPKTVVEKAKKEDAAAAKEKLEEAGAKVELK